MNKTQIARLFASTEADGNNQLFFDCSKVANNAKITDYQLIFASGILADDLNELSLDRLVKFLNVLFFFKQFLLENGVAQE